MAIVINGTGTIAGVSATGITTAPTNATDTTKLPLAGGTMTGDLILGDGIKLALGNKTGGDLAIYHDGSNSYVRDGGTGDLLLQGRNSVKLQDISGENYFVGTVDGSAELYHNNVKKLETSSTGVNVTGTITGATNLGTVLQVVNATNDTSYTTTSSSYVDTLSLAITPKFSNSKILITINGGAFANNANSVTFTIFDTRLLRGSTDVYQQDLWYLDARGSGTLFGQQKFMGGWQYLDSPNTTNATTYKVQTRWRGSGGTPEIGFDKGVTITLMEIAG